MGTTLEVVIDLAIMASNRLLLLAMMTVGISPAGTIVDTAPALTFTFTDATPGDQITISNGPFTGGAQTLAIAGTSTNTFEAGNKVAIVVNDTGGGDTIIVNFSLIATGLTALTVNGGNGADTFIVTPPPLGLPLTINGGGNPQMAPGNVLTVLLAGTTGASLVDMNTSTGLQGSWTFTSNSPVNFTGMETVTVPEPGVLPMVAVGLAGLLIAGIRLKNRRA